MKRRYTFTFFLAMGFCLLSVFQQPAQAQLTTQANPVFSTPPPEEQKLGPQSKPFEGKPVVLDPTVDAKEFTVETVEFEGNHYYNDTVLKGQLKPLLEKLEKQDALLSTSDLEKELARINKQNKFKLQAHVEKGAEDGKADLHLDVYEQQPWQIAGTFDNQGRPGIGTFRGGVQVLNDSLLGFGDQLKFQYVGANRSQFISASYTMPWNRWGGTFSLQYVNHHINYDSDFTTPVGSRLTGQDNAWILTLAQPIDKNRVWTPYVSTLFRHVTLDRTLPGSSTEVRTLKADPRPWTLGIRYNKTDKYGETFVDAMPLIVGQRWSGGDSQFYRAKAVMRRTLKLPKDNLLVFRGTWQLSPDPLPAVQELPLGGAYGVRGYTEGLITADRGHFYSLEHNWPVPFVGDACPWLKGRLRGVTFFDFGQAWVDSSSTRYVGGVSNKANRTLLMAVGAGLRYNMSQYLQGFVDAGWGLYNRDVMELKSDPTVRVHFGIRSNLLPKPFKKRDGELVKL